MKPIEQCYLYGFIDTGYVNGRSVVDLTTSLCDGGVDILQLRAKDIDSEGVLRLAEQIKTLTDRFGVPLVINDHPHVALQIGAAYCHLGQEDLLLGANEGKSLETVGPSGSYRLGVSTHSPEQASGSICFKPAYLGVGPVFPTATKPNAKPVSLEYVRWASKNVTIPWFAIGGISLSNLDDVMAAGARRICVVSGILCAPDPARACKSFKDRLASAA